MSDFHSKAFENDKYFQLKYCIRKQDQKSTVQEKVFKEAVPRKVPRINIGGLG
jgi:hypothetical protein